MMKHLRDALKYLKGYCMNEGIAVGLYNLSELTNR